MDAIRSPLSQALRRAYRFITANDLQRGPYPALNLDFLNNASVATFDPRITFARASNATYFNSAGVLTTAGNNVARLDYDPVTRLPRGLLVEEQRVNYLLSSRDLRSAAAGNPITAWSNTDTTVARTQVGIDGVANSACLITEGVAGTARLSQSGTITAGASTAYSLVLKRGNTDWVRATLAAGTGSVDVWFNLATGVKGNVTPSGTASATSGDIQNLGGGWYRCIVIGIGDGAATTATCYLNSASANASATRVAGATYIVDCAQLEAGSFATSIIPTTTASATRSADSASITGTNFSSWYNQTQGTFVVEGDINSTYNFTTNNYIFGASDGSLNNRVSAFRPTSAPDFSSRVTAGGAAQLAVNQGGAITAGTVFKCAVAYGGSGSASTAGGAAPQSGTATSPTGVNVLYIGNNEIGTQVQSLNGHIRRIQYWPQRLGNSTLQALTA